MQLKIDTKFTKRAELAQFQKSDLDWKASLIFKIDSHTLNLPRNANWPILAIVCPSANWFCRTWLATTWYGKLGCDWANARAMVGTPAARPCIRFYYWIYFQRKKSKVAAKRAPVARHSFDPRFWLWIRLRSFKFCFSLSFFVSLSLFLCFVFCVLLDTFWSL